MADVTIGAGLVGIAASLAIGLSAIAAAMAQKSIGSAAVGAMAEKKELFVNGLILTAIPETIVILGFLVASSILLIAKGG